MKCVNCKHCIGYDGMISYYICETPDGSIEYIEECIANDDKMGCDLYEQDSDDDFTTGS